MIDTYQIVTDRITAALEQGTVPWQKPWAAQGGTPRNLVSKKPYRGMNVVLLALAPEYGSPWWATFKQAKELGGYVRKGEKASLVTFWKLLDLPNQEGDGDGGAGEREGRRAPLLRQYWVFNSEQCEGLDVPVVDRQPKEHDRIEACEAVVHGMPLRPRIERNTRQACYHPVLDYVGMPDPSQFESTEGYYATLFHELAHSTGHENRLARPMIQAPAPFGSPDYSQEELVAEFGAAFLCAHTGIFPRVADNSAAYIDGWLRVLQGDKKLFPVAAARAQRAADFILGEQARQEPENE